MKMKRYVQIRDIARVIFFLQEDGMVVGQVEMKSQDYAFSPTPTGQMKIELKYDSEAKGFGLFLNKKFQRNQNYEVWVRGNGFRDFTYVHLPDEPKDLILITNDVVYVDLPPPPDTSNRVVPELTPEQVERWRDVLEGMVGIFARLMPESMVRQFHRKFQLETWAEEDRLYQQQVQQQQKKRAW